MKKQVQLFIGMAVAAGFLATAPAVTAQTADTIETSSKSKMITGCIIDEYGYPTARGAEISVNGTDIITTSDSDGIYSIEAEGTDSLTFTYRYVSETFTAKQLESHNVTVKTVGNYFVFVLTEKNEYKPKYHISVADEFMFGYTSVSDEKRNEIARICSLQ